MLTLLVPLAIQAAQPAPAPPPAPAAPASVEEADARCVLAFATMGKDSQAKTQQDGAALGALFYYGKLIGRNPRIDLARVLLGAAPAVTAAPAAELSRCGDELKVAGDAMKAAGDAIDAP